MSFNTALIAELKHESANTRKMLERVPTDKLDWQPHEKSMKLERLASHIAELPIWFERIINSNEFDFATAVLKREPKENSEAIVELFDERLASAIKALESASDENLSDACVQRALQALTHEPGHDNHVHVRLRCPENSACQNAWVTLANSTGC